MDGGDRSMADADWATVYERQTARAHLLPRLGHLLGLESGDRVLELGCGPGGATGWLAAHVAPGRVLAVDRHRAALEYLRTTVGATDPVDPILADVETLPLRCPEPTPTMAAFVLHHIDDPVGAVEAVASSLPAGSTLLVAEYDPAAPGEVGPSPAHRIASDDVRDWLEGAGFAVESTVDLQEEAYAVRGRRKVEG